MKRFWNESISRTRKQGFRLGIVALATATLATVSIVHAQKQDGPIGKVTQGLIGGSVVPESTQEDFALVSISDSCSGSLLRNGWIITAAHCVEQGGGIRRPMPDRARPGQNLLDPIADIRVTANWKEKQERKAVRVETFRPYDIAIIQLDAPFKRHGSTTGFSRLISQDGQFPHWGENVGTSMVIFGRGIHALAQAGPPAIPTQQDGKYRIGYVRPNREDAHYFYYGGTLLAGGDSGGPSFVSTLSGYALAGVHSFSFTRRVPGKPTTGWDWVSSVSQSADALVTPVWPQILRIIGPMPPSLPDAPPPGFIGTFAKTPPNFQPMWVYGIRPNGELVWYRKDSNASAWQGPKVVARGWHGFKDVIAAGGNRFYALTNDGQIIWYQHDGFNTGTVNWKGPSYIGKGWTFKKIFSGGEGIIYAIRQDGKLFWYRHTGFENGGRIWSEAKEVGSQWDTFTDVFCTGKGAVYAVTPDGKLMLYQQNDYANGAKSWKPAQQLGVGWNSFQQIIPVDDGVILAVTKTGKLWYYRYLGMAPPSRIRVPKPVWEGPVELGSGWQDFGKVVALIPLATPPVVR